MAKIKPTFTLVSNASSATTDPGPLSFALNLTAKPDGNVLTVDEIESEIFDVDTGANTTIMDGSTEAAAFVSGTNGCYIYLKNITSSGTDKICVGILNEGVGAPAVDDGTDDLTRSHADSHRTMTLAPGEFAFFPFDYCGDIYAQATANDQKLEFWRFNRSAS